ncbi:MAG TPA: hypothetical protein VEN78_06290 [Bradyrhizobium sp.]|nr:hypothetical protein [Bradyrhizobium sp.]
MTRSGRLSGQKRSMSGSAQHWTKFETRRRRQISGEAIGPAAG